ncbi:MAG: hypothetical protein COT06_09555 [Syntrophobacteraceae bacterium CG07_land_8_20_14_0_80_61_8]|nr:MAG: hypothetical protein COT06_09555 [Syntrophobacteraceae bacterium CG07_land_8_20_14_0_80_61_8]
MPLPNFGGERSSTNRFALRPAFLEPGSGGRPWFATCKAAPSDPRMKRPPAYFYDLDERPPWHWLVLYALQWAVILFPALIIAARLCAQALNLTAAEEVRFVQLTLLVSGLFTVFQTLYGHRYPVLEGPSTAVLLTYALLARNGLGVIQGGAIIAGVALAVLVLTGAVQRLLRFITPNVVGVILMLIAFTLLPHLVRPVIGSDGAHPEGDPIVFALALVLVLLITTGSHWLTGIWKTLTVFFGMLLGTAVFAVLGRLDPAPLQSAAWVSLPRPWASLSPTLYWPAVLSYGFAYLAVLVNSLGSLQGIAAITAPGRLPRAIRRGLMVNAIGGICCGALGIVGTVSYSTSPGVLLVNRVASRFAVTGCGVLLALAALVPKLSSLLALVPASVVAAALCVAMGGQVGAGLAIVSGGKELASRDYFVVGIPIVLGTFLSLLPEPFLALLPGPVRVLMGNGLIAGIFLVLLLEHCLLPAPRPAAKE